VEENKDRDKLAMARTDNARERTQMSATRVNFALLRTGIILLLSLLG
jgi:hypothetical protein